MKKVSKIIATIINKNIQKEMNSACAIFGYQPVVPDSAKSLRIERKIVGEKYRNLIDKITYDLVTDNSIDSSDVDAYKFGLEVTILKAFHYVSYIVLALCMKKFFEFVIIFAVLYVFRRNTGGYHAQTRIGCYLFSCAVIFISFGNRDKLQLAGCHSNFNF